MDITLEFILEISKEHSNNPAFKGGNRIKKTKIGKSCRVSQPLGSGQP